MGFHVAWTEEARDELASVWLSHWDRAGVTAATHQIDLLLSRDPHGQGESREADQRRIMFESPLVVIYAVNDAGREVVVSHVRAY